MKVHVRKNILMVKLVCVFKVAEYTCCIKRKSFSLKLENATSIVTSDNVSFKMYWIKKVHIF